MIVNNQLVVSKLKFQASLEITQKLSILGPNSQKVVMLGSWVTTALFGQGMGSPACHSLHPIHFSLSCGFLTLLHSMQCVHAMHHCAGGGCGLGNICWESLGSQEYLKTWRRALATPIEVL